MAGFFAPLYWALGTTILLPFAYFLFGTIGGLFVMVIPILGMLTGLFNLYRAATIPGNVRERALLAASGVWTAVLLGLLAVALYLI